MCGKDVVSIVVAAVVMVVVPTALAAFFALAHNGNRVLAEYVVAKMLEVLERWAPGVVDLVLP
jgi:uncharacterized protein YqhQ